MKLKRIPAGVYAANCYILMDEETRETVIIDPGGDAEDLKRAVEELKCIVKYILLTHGHADHTGAVSELSKYYSVPFGISEKDEKMALNNEFMYGGFYKKADFNLSQGDIFKIGNKEIKCIATPGHTPGGMCFLIDNMLFTGDTLFSSSIGRTDLAGGDFEALMENIKTKLMALPEETIVLPGHGAESTIKREKMHNPYL